MVKMLGANAAESRILSGILGIVQFVKRIFTNWFGDIAPYVP